MIPVSVAVLLVAVLAFLLIIALRRSSATDAAAPLSLRITQLFIYPLKSGAAVPVQRVELDRLGFRWDRRWLVVSEATLRHVSQRDYPRMALITPTIDEAAQTLSLSFPGESEVIRVVLQPSLDRAEADGVEASDVTVWDDDMAGLLYTDPAISAWFGRVLQLPEDRAGLRLGTTLGTAAHQRPMQTAFDRTPGVAQLGEGTAPINPGFGDQFPVLLASEASLEAVNKWTVPKGRKVEMLAFRPNLVVGGVGLKPWAEDYWRKIRVGGSSAAPAASSSSSSSSAPATAAEGVDFFVAKASARCILTTVVPSEGRFHPTGEPLLSLREHRKVLEHVPSQAGGAFFAQHLAHLTDHGFISLGDTFTVLEHRQHMYDPAPGQEPEQDRHVVAQQNREAAIARGETSLSSNATADDAAASKKDL